MISDTCNNETDGATQKDSAELVNNNVKKEGRIRPQIFTATSAIPTPLCGYKPFRHQVGGHLMVQDSPCFMLDDDGHLLKLLEEKSLKEKAFYEKIFMEEPENQQWHELKKYLPRYYGPVNIISGREELCYLKMDNLIGHLKKPCIMDLKIGKKTFDPFAGPDKIQRELIRYKYQAQLGFRITGFKVYKAKTGITELYDRFHCKGINPEDIVKTFVQFFDLEDFPERRILVSEMIRRLKRLLKWFENQMRIKFFRTSLLIAYDGSVQLAPKLDDVPPMKRGLEDLRVETSENIYNLESKEYLSNKFQKLDISDIIESSSLKGKTGVSCEVDQVISDSVALNMIDFAHTFCDLEDMSSTLDDNYMFGLRSAIDHLEQCLSL